MEITEQDRENAKPFEHLAHVLGQGHHDMDLIYPWQPEYHARMRELGVDDSPRTEKILRTQGQDVN